MDRRVAMIRELMRHPDGMTREELREFYLEIGEKKHNVVSIVDKVAKTLESYGVVTFDRNRIKYTGKGFTLVEIRDGKEVKVVY